MPNQDKKAHLILTKGMRFHENGISHREKLHSYKQGVHQRLEEKGGIAAIVTTCAVKSKELQEIYAG
jgi:hypothetical protein